MSQDTIGIVGCEGNLGSKMAIQACANYNDVMGFDIAGDTTVKSHGIDQNIIHQDNPIIRVRRLDVLLNECSIVHWCATSHTLNTVQAVHPNSLVILHDSVMSSSLHSAQVLQAKTNNTAKLAIAHCLMNTHNKVVVASDYGVPQEAADHLLQLGLSPTLKSVQEHDRIMARSQAVLSVLVKTILPDLIAYENDGLLTQSAHELLGSLQHRESRRTSATMVTMLANPALSQLMNELSSFIADHQNSK